jgi:H+-transporting ATPase
MARSDTDGSADHSSFDSVVGSLETDPGRGLTLGEAQRRLGTYGENTLREHKVSRFWKLLSYFWGPIPWMIEIAACLSALVQHWADFSIIVTLLLINAGVGFWQEFKADNAIQLLKQKLALTSKVLRDGKWRTIASGLLVAGDIIFLKLGDIIPADVMLLEGEYLSVDQSALTGESLTVDKKVGDSAYSGSIARRGEMKALVTTTGMNTYFGKTARLVETAETRSHFQLAVLRIGNFLIVSALILVAVILVVALFRHDPLMQTLQFALILTVASIPVTLPTVLSVTMAVGAEGLARMQAIVSRLVAIEEMAGLDVLCCDKTGTLTKNQLTVSDPILLQAKDEEDLMTAAVLASEANSDDPIDSAIFFRSNGTAVLEKFEVQRFRPFDPVIKRT